MKVMIDIPKEFESDLQDKFNEFFERVKCDINSSLESQEVSMCGNYERETVEMFLSAFEKATIIPDDATNGDMLLTTFETATVYVIDKENDWIIICIDNYFYQKFRYSWWNAPYKKEVEE